MKRRAIIIGAGPAGLTAAYELLTRTDIIPVVIEKSQDIGGISKTVNYKGNRIDIGGHRFFSKSNRVMKWWMDMMPVQTDGKSQFHISYQNKSRQLDIGSNTSSNTGDERDPDLVMLVRRRLSRIYFLRKFFSYPIQLSIDTLVKLGLWTTISIMLSYLRAQLFQRKPERHLEDFMINRFGSVLYKLFFKDYTEKVWGVSCDNISAEWGAQRIKGISISKAIQHALQSAAKGKARKDETDIAQKDTETSLIEQFLYPKFGPGQLWEEVARKVEAMGGRILMQHDVKRIYTSDNDKKIVAVAAINNLTGETSYLEGDYFFSTMPVKELIGGLDGSIPEDVKIVASGLQYRDFITVGILLKKLSYQDKKTGEWKPLDLKDTWIYIQEKDVKVGRLQLFNNWSPYMVKDPANKWIGMEFFCNTEDNFWKLSDEEIKHLAISELEKIGLACETNVLDATVLRMEKTYPAYFGAYGRFDVIRNYIDQFENLFLVGRNGMHKYNNSDHSMLTAMVAVDNISLGITTKENIWSINTEQEYHEEKVQTESHSKMQPKQKTVEQESLKEFIFKNPANRWYLIIAFIGVMLQISIFKFLYPFAGFINGDSYVYLEAAHWNFDINVYPVGYSKFLRIFSVFTKSDTVLVVFQYLLLQASALSFIMSLFYYYKPTKTVKALLFLLTLFNPAFLYVSNYVSSDALFLSLSLIWLNLLVWILYKPNMTLLVWHALIIFIAFTVRYNALYYPLISILVFIFSKQHLWKKLAGIGIAILVIGLFIHFTSNRYYNYVGKRQFSPFSGWQLANNAMYAYRFVDSANLRPVPARFKKLDKMVRTYIDTSRDVEKHPHEMLMASTVYMWDSRSPLQIYKEQQFKNDSAAGPVKKWATVAPLYAEYGSFLIRTYPTEFAKYYLWPNALKYYAPPVEFLDKYNMGIDSVSPVAQQWFDYKTTKVSTRFKDFEVNTLNFYPVFTGTVNVVFLFSILGLFMIGLKEQLPEYRTGLILSFSLWLINFAFSVFSSPVALRFQLFPIVVTFSFAFIYLERLIIAAKGMERDEYKPRIPRLNPTV